MARQLRWPLDAAEFNRLKLPAAQVLLPEGWWNLRWEAHLTAATVFHASKTGRRMAPKLEKIGPTEKIL